MNSNASANEGSLKKVSLHDEPVVSIVTPVRNGIKYLEVCIQSVLNQSYPRIEHIFVDGGSTDGTLDMLVSYRAKYPSRIKFISEPDNGVGDALNKGFRMATGDIFAWLDADDTYLPDAILTAVNFFRSTPSAYYLYGGVDIIGESGQALGEVPIKDFDFQEVVKGNHFISLSAALFRRQVFERVGDFSVMANNFDYWIRITRQFQMHFVNRKLCTWRLDGGSLGMSKEKRCVAVRMEKLKEDYLLCRQYGGGILAPRCRKYYSFLIVNRLGMYRFIDVKKLFELRRYRLVDKLMRVFGA